MGEQNNLRDSIGPIACSENNGRFDVIPSRRLKTHVGPICLLIKCYYSVKSAFPHYDVHTYNVDLPGMKARRV